MLHKLVKKFENPAGPITLESEESPEVTEYTEVNEDGIKPSKKSSQYGSTNFSGQPLLNGQGKGANVYEAFAKRAFPRNYNICRHLGLDENQAEKIATYLTLQQGLESTYGTSDAARLKHNRTGSLRTKNKKTETIPFDSEHEQDLSLIKGFTKNLNWNRALKAKTLQEYIYHLQTPNPKDDREHKYENTMTAEQYYKKINDCISMRRALENYKKNNRHTFAYATPNETDMYGYPDLSDLSYLS